MSLSHLNNLLVSPGLPQFCAHRLRDPPRFFFFLLVFQSEATTERENTRTVHRPPKAAPFAAAWSKAESTEPPKRRPTMRVISKQATYVQQHRRSLASQERLGSRSRVGEIRGRSRESGRPGSPDRRWLSQSCFRVVKHTQKCLR